MHTSAGDSWIFTGKSGSVSCRVTAPRSWCTQGFIVPSKSLFPWGFSVLLLDPQVGKSVVGPRTFATVWEILYYNCSPVCGSSAWQLYGGANGNLLQEDLWHTPRLPGLLQPEPLSLWQITADAYLQRRHSNTQRRVWLNLLWGSLFLSLSPGAHKVLFVPSKCLWWVWDLILNTIAPLLQSCCGLSFALGHGASFFDGVQHSHVDGFQ